MKKSYKMKKTISIKQFVTEFGEDLSKHMNDKILELWPRCVLTRETNRKIFDIKHVEHTLHDCVEEDNSASAQKEYSYGQFIINDNVLYFSERSLESDTVMQMPVVDTIYDFLSSMEICLDEGYRAKEIDDSNIDYVINSILEVCPAMSQAHIDMISRYCDVDGFEN